MQTPLLSGIVVHWRNEDKLVRLLEAWPRDPRFELVIVDNGSGPGFPSTEATVLMPERNLGFAGGVNLGMRTAAAPLVLVLNPDARPREGALEALLEGFQTHPDAAGLAPRLLGPAGEPQHQWQLRPLPSAGTLLLHTLFVPAGASPREEPAEGTVVEQPAAAALALRREALAEVGGFDPRFHPAWFEDVDLARRLAAAGRILRYWPAASFEHDLGSSLPGLGYDRFLWIYHRNLCRYLAKHHGARWELLARLSLAAGFSARALLLPLRQPRRAASRRDALRGLLATAVGALSGWRRPRSYTAVTRPEPAHGDRE